MQRIYWKRSETENMKFLLIAINTKYIHSNPAIYSLKAYAKEAGKQVELAEYTINQQMGDILADIYSRKPQVLAFSCYIWNIEMVGQLLAELPKLLPGVPIWLGGPEVSYEAERFLASHPRVTGIMVGEGEETFKQVLEYYIRKYDRLTEIHGGSPEENADRQASAAYLMEDSQLSQIPGLCLPQGRTRARELTNLSSLPFLYDDLEAFENKIIYYESSRGCPFRCSYCLSSIDKKVRLRDMEIVKKELQFFLDQKVKQVKFVDRTFNCNHEHALSIWKYLADHDNGVTNFHFEISADLLKEDELEVLHSMRPGLAQLEIGVQSANPRTLEAIHRTMDLDRLEQIVAQIHAGHNVHMHLDLIAGLPYEDYDSFAASFNRVYAMRPEQLQLGFLKVLKGSEMYEKASEYGIAYLDKPPYEVLFTPWLPYDKVRRLKQIEEMVERYYNSNQFVTTLRVLEKAFPTPFAMYEALADYYEEKGYFLNSPARSYRYDVLLSFAVLRDPDHEDFYKEALIYDLYLRENLKSRPSFARDLSYIKDRSREIYEKEEAERVLLPGYEGYDSKQLSKMTHLEPFSYRVWEGEKVLSAGPAVKPEDQTYILFDYQHRNPLTGDARTVEV